MLPYLRINLYNLMAAFHTHGLLGKHTEQVVLEVFSLT